MAVPRMKVVGLTLPMDTYEVAAQMARDSGMCVGTKIRLDLVELYARADRRRRAAVRTKETEGGEE